MPEQKLESQSASSPHPVRPIRILALCDSPALSANKFVLSTGFGRVARNILGQWVKSNYQSGSQCARCGEYVGGHATGAGDICTCPQVKVDCWAINFNGWGYQNSPIQLFPAGGRWNSPERLQQFLQFLVDGGYTHLWMLMDPDALSVSGFPAALKKVCANHGIRTLLYYPVDAAMEREWLEIVQAVDVAVTYTEYGRDQTRKAMGQSAFPIAVIPHGVDDVFRPLSVEQRQPYRNIPVAVPAVPDMPSRPGRKARELDFLKPNDFLILNVNKNEWRKDPLRSLEILKGLRELGVPAKLLLRMDPMSAMGGVQLDLAAAQLGLTYGEEYLHICDIPDENLCGLYNAADLYLTTSMGEGWGLGVSEAMSCHCPVAMARHTSLAEIGNENTLWLPLEKSYVCGADTRLRRRVDLAGAVGVIAEAYKGGVIGNGERAGDRLLLGWGDVAEQMFKLLVGGGR